MLFVFMSVDSYIPRRNAARTASVGDVIWSVSSAARNRDLVLPPAATWTRPPRFSKTLLFESDSRRIQFAAIPDRRAITGFQRIERGSEHRLRASLETLNCLRTRGSRTGQCDHRHCPGSLTSEPERAEADRLFHQQHHDQGDRDADRGNGCRGRIEVPGHVIEQLDR